jgi:putative intracellular protease/amidase
LWYRQASEAVASFLVISPPVKKEKVMKILMVLTSHDKLGNTGRKTGFWLEEFAAPYYRFMDSRNAEIVIASPKGGQPPPCQICPSAHSLKVAPSRLQGSVRETEDIPLTSRQILR